MTLMVCCLVATAAAAPDGTPYTLFESGQTRPLALSPDGKSLAALNTPDNRVELFAIGPGGRLSPRGSVAVGYEPIALAWRDGRELWVVNHVSDSVSVVRLDGAVLRSGGGAVGQVVRTLLVGDEPGDITFAGPHRSRAFITSARRGQNVTTAALGERGVDPALTTPGLERAIVWVFAADGEAESVGGTPLTRIELFTDTPRALAVSPDGARVFAAGFRTGNRTASLAAQVWRNRGWVQEEIAGVPQQAMSLLVRLVGDRWLTHDGRDFTADMRFTLPDEDVFVIDAMAPVPRAINGMVYRGVGTVLYAMAVNPQSGNVYVANTDARNHVGAEPALRCDATRNRITVLTPGGQVHARELDTHLPIAGDRCAVPRALADLSLAIPTGVAVSPDGRQMFVTAMGSDALAIIDTERLERGEHRSHSDDIVRLSGGGPTGVVHHPAHDVAYVLTRFDDGISVVDVGRRAEVQHLRMHSPEPLAVTRGRRLLYDARNTSKNGQMACASCHVFAHTDHLGWDLGNPDADPLPTLAQPFVPTLPEGLFPNFEQSVYVHQQLKGVMVTQSLRGLDNHGPMHWRGDRYDARVLFPLLRPSVQPDTGVYDEREAFKSFNGTFVSLHGLDAELPEAEMAALTEFALRLTYPPNAIRNLDDSLTAEQARGRDRYFDRDRPVDAIGPCAACHVLDPDGNAEHGVARPGFFGTDGRMTFDALPQLFKVPHLRNLYDKVGLFGTSPMAFLQPIEIFSDDFGRPIPATAHLGRQVRGFGFAHDGSLDAVQRYLSAIPFHYRPPQPEEVPFVGHVPFVGIERDGPDRDALAAFVMAYPGNLAPIVAQQLTLSDRNMPAAAARLTLFVQRHDAGDCDLIARRSLGGRERGFAYVGGGLFVDDRGAQHPLLTLLRDLNTSPLTFTCAAPFEGRRLALDRDQDALFDGVELDLGTDSQDPQSPGRLMSP